jgi:transcriptional regulator with XRE-family HTH domain
MTLEDLAGRAGIGRSTAQRIESGAAASLETYARVAAALSLRPELSFANPTRREGSGRRDDDAVHAAMGEIEARQLRTTSVHVAIDEPYQHFQFAGRADVVAWDAERRSLLHLENRTRFPNMQEAAGSYNAKRAWFPDAFAKRLRLRAGWLSVTHAIVALWSSEVLHSLRLRRSTFEALCPDDIDAVVGWWSGHTPTMGVTSTLVIFDPGLDLGRRRRFVGLDAIDRIEPRYRGYADAARALGGPVSR